MNGIYKPLILRFGILKFFVLRYTNRPCVWGSSCWSLWPRKVARIRSIKYEKKNWSRRAWKRSDWCKKSNEKLIISFWWTVIGTRSLKFPFDIRELPYKLRTGKETNRQSSIYASLSGRLTDSFKDAIESILKGCSRANKIEIWKIL